jgi:hypothetical protein
MSDHEIPQLDKKGLREFGLILGGIFVGLFGVLLPLLHKGSLQWWPLVIAVPLWFLAIFAPSLLNPVYKFWMKVGLFLGSIMTPIWMGLVFYLVVLPMGIIMRAAGKDPMARELDGNLPTYRIPSNVRTKESMERPF